MEGGVAFGQHHPVACFGSGSVAGAFLLLLHFGIKSGFIDLQTGFTADEFCEVEGETIGVKEREGFFAVHHLFIGGFRGLDDTFETADTRGEGAEEGLFLFANDLGDELLLSGEFGIGTAHLLHERGDEFADESLALVEEGVSITHGTAQDAANDVAGLGVGG